MAHVTHSGITPTSEPVPDFPMFRIDGGRMVYQEALIGGQYLGAHLSAMGRPKPRWWIWEALSGGATSDRPLRTSQHAFGLEVNGQLLADGWEWVASSETEDAVVVVLRHAQRAIKVEVHTRSDGTPFFARHLVITNDGDQPAALAAVAPWSGMVWQAGATHWDDIELDSLPSSPFTVGRMTDSSPGSEGAFDWLPVPIGEYSFGTMHGKSGWGYPFAMVRNEVTGELLVVSFAWSGNWQIGLINDYEPGHTTKRDARLYARVSLAGPAPLRVLEPGESATTPTVHVGTVFGGLDDAAQALHDHIRRSVVPHQPAGRRHLVEVNHTAFTRNYLVTEEQLYDEIDMAAELGAELFMLDAGWFGGVDTPWWFETIGDWDESPLLKSGVNAALDRARAQGMLVGLWVEPERMGKESKLLAQHPDWQMRRRGQDVLNLDLSRPEVEQYFEQTIVGIIERYNLDCFRIDYNHTIGEGGEAQRGGYTENVLWRYYDALYGVFDRVRDRFPELLLENCSSGGGRADLGMLGRFQWTQVTDRWSPGPTARIMNGMTIALPPELCESVPGGISEGVSDIDFVIRVCLFGHFNATGFFPTLADRNEETFRRWQHGIGLYKDFCRPIIGASRLFHHTPIQRQTEPGEWIVLENASEDRTRAYAGVFRLLGADSDAYRLRLRGVDAGRRYRVRYDTSGDERVMDGGQLVDQGLMVRVPGALRSELLLVEAVE